MGIFSRNVTPENTHGAKTIVSIGCEIRGEIGCPGNVHIDGLIDGHLHVDQAITIGKEGRLLGNAETNQLFVSGEFVGQANCRQLIIMPGGRFCGELTCESLTIEDGGRFEGNCVHKPFCPTTESDSTATVALTVDRTRDNSPLLQSQV